LTKAGADKLISAVGRAWGKELKLGTFNDRLVMQKGCFLLNDMGVLPSYNFSLYVRGPYSSELADDYYELMKSGNFSADTYIDVEYIDKLSRIMRKGPSYLEAYSTMVLAREYNPNMSKREIEAFVCNMKPALKKEIEEASASLPFL
jgi:uncharacterized protein YwgA